MNSEEQRIFEATRRLSEENEYNKRLLSESVERENALRRELSDLRRAYDGVANSLAWKITKPLRLLGDLLKKFPPTRLMLKGIHALFTRGPGYTAAKMRERGAMRRMSRSLGDLTKISDEQRREEEARVFDEPHTFSILVPLYNTPVDFLREMVASVEAQTYPGWELCLADGSDEKHPEVGEEALRLAAADPRIRYRRLAENLGISGNTNACIDMATGDYIALFDHDDLLHPSALYEMMIAITGRGADFVYTDEAVFASPDPSDVISVHYKPDFAIDNLRANNYICHFSAFSRRVLDEAGRFRPAFDGSQDHDMILRLTEKAKCVVHIPKILYLWRSHPASVAMDISSKTYAIDAGIRAVSASLERAGLPAFVASSPVFPAIYRVEYRITRPGKTSILPLGKGAVEDLASYGRLDGDFEIVLPQGSVVAVPEELKEKVVYAKDPIAAASGEYFLFVDPTFAPVSTALLEELSMYAQRDDVGCVTGKSFDRAGRIVDSGIFLAAGEDGLFAPVYRGFANYENGYMSRLCYAQNISAVGASFFMVRREVFFSAGGFRPEFSCLASVDLSLRLSKKGLLNVFNPYAEAYVARAADKPSPAERAEREKLREAFGEETFARDPYYNPNFAPKSADFSM